MKENYIKKKFEKKRKKIKNIFFTNENFRNNKRKSFLIKNIRSTWVSSIGGGGFAVVSSA